MGNRNLTLIRHAKASPEERGRGGDFDRPLTERGERDAVRIGRRLAAAHVLPGLILSSPARRARQTAEAIAAELCHPAHLIQRSDDLYLASERRLLECVHATDPSIRHLVMVGHNPGLSDLWDWLTRDEGVGLPTCGVVRLELDTEGWSEVLPGCAVLVEFDYPKRAV